MRRIIISITISVLAVADVLYSQPEIIWSQTFGGDSNEECRSIIQTADGGFALAGYTNSFGEGQYDSWLVQTDEQGDSLWSATYGQAGYDNCSSIIHTGDQGLALAGHTRWYSEPVGSYVDDIWLLCTDEDGDSLWSYTYDGVLQQCYSLIQTADGGFALAGRTGHHEHNSPHEYFGDFFLMRTNETGETLWSQSFDLDDDDICYSVIETADGGFVLAGSASSRIYDRMNAWLVKTNQHGEQLWSHNYGGEQHDYYASAAIIQTEDGGFALAGYMYSYDSESLDIWLLRLNADGNSLWSCTFGGEYRDVASSIIQTEDEGFVLAGTTESFGAGGTDFWLVRTDADGDSLWSQTYGGEDNEVASALIQTTDGGFVAAGYTDSFGSGQRDYWMVKTSSDPVSVSKIIDPVLPQQITLLPVYPNPFNSTTTIRYGLPSPDNVSLQLYNLSGQRISTLFEGQREAGVHSATISAIDLTSGQYFARLTSGSRTAVERLIVIK